MYIFFYHWLDHLLNMPLFCLLTRVRDLKLGACKAQLLPGIESPLFPQFAKKWPWSPDVSIEDKIIKLEQYLNVSLFVDYLVWLKLLFYFLLASM